MSVSPDQHALNPPPGWTLSRMMKEQQLEVVEVAWKLNLTVSQMHDLMEGSLPLTESIAVRLQETFGLIAGWWLHREQKYRSSF